MKFEPNVKMKSRNFCVIQIIFGYDELNNTTLDFGISIMKVDLDIFFYIIVSNKNIN